jgi:sensor c-di-GMP phosphodiesterase-like protein
MILGVLCVVLPVGLSIVLAVHRGQRNAVASLNEVADEVTHRSKETHAQVVKALAALEEGDALSAPCSLSGMARMQSIAAATYYVQGLGYIENDTLLCSTLTSAGNPVPLGPPSPVRSSGLRGWGPKVLPDVPGQEFNFVGRKNYVAVVIPELVLDDPLPSEKSSLLQVRPEGTVIRSRGTYSPEWLKRDLGVSVTFADANSLVVVRPDTSTGLTVLATMPMEDAHRLVIRELKRLVPLALGVSAILVGLVCLYTRELLSMRSQLKAALKARDFFLLYQPVMDLKKGHCVGAEALIRWKHTDGMLVSPLVFIPAAEQYGLIEQVTLQVMEMVAHDAVQLIREYPEAHIAINFSPDDLYSAEIENRLQALIRSVGASNNIVIEATERGLLFPEKVMGTLISVRSKGFKVGIDDFGTGNSSLSYLGMYDLDFLKIDKMFVDSLGKEGTTSQVAFHIIELAHSLGLQIVAEGVETHQQREILRDAGVQYAQGWVFAKPMAMGELAEFMRVQNA